MTYRRPSRLRRMAAWVVRVCRIRICGDALLYRVAAVLTFAGVALICWKAARDWGYIPALFGIIWVAVGLSCLRSARKADRENRVREGLCPTCGYDLTGNVSGVCPECGESV